MSINTKIVGNVFFDVNFNSNDNFNLGIIYKASLPDSGEYSCKFWDYFVPKDIRESNSTNENWEYAINESRKERELIKKKEKLLPTTYKSNGGNSTKSEGKDKNNLWYKLKGLWS